MNLLAADQVNAISLVDLLSTLSKAIGFIGAFWLIGSLLAMTFFLEDNEGALSEDSLALIERARIAAGVWALGTFGVIIFTLANILASSVSVALDYLTLKSFLTQVTLGKIYLVELIVALLVFLLIGTIRRVIPALLALLISLIALAAPAFQSHSASSGSHALAIGSLVVHVAGLALWVGGVIGLLMISPTSRASALRRFTSLALWAAIAVVASGSANAFARVNFKSAWMTTYTLVLLGKVLLTCALLFIGYLHRKNLKEVTRIDIAQALKLLLSEAVIMIVAVLMGSWISNQGAPVRPGSDSYNAGLEIAGLSTPAKPNTMRLIFAYDPDALMIALLVAATALYIKGVLILHKRGDKWPVGRTVAFALGMATIDYATSGALGVYAKFAFSYHMIAHMLLGMIAPIGIILGAPITLALRTLPQGRSSTERGPRGTLVAILHSRFVGFYSHPVVALSIFDGSLFALYLTPAFGDLMSSHTGHFLMNVHFILAGALFFHVIIGIDPNPRRVHHLVRIVTLFAAMGIHAFFSVAVLSASSVLDGGYYASLKTPWVSDVLADQGMGGAIGWAMGEIPILLALAATFIQWMREDKRETKRIDRNIARKAAMGEPDELAEYNAYLQELAARDRGEKA